MSIEAKLEALTAAVEANTAALEGASAPAKTGGTKTSTKTATSTKKKAATTVDVLAKRFGAYLSAGDAEAKKTAKTNVKKLVDHYEVGRVSEVDESKYDEVLGYLDQLEAGENPFEDDEEEEGMI